MNWFENWFNQDYLDLYSDRNDEDASRQVDLIIDKLNLNPQQTILDVGCGTGRHVKIFSDLGFKVTGIDQSSVLVEIGRKKNPELQLFHQTPKDLVEAGESFDLVVSLFTSFGYYDLKGNLKMLKEMVELIRSGGNLWMDLLNPSSVLNQPLKDSLTRTSRLDPLTGQEVEKYFLERRRINLVDQQFRIEKEITLSTGHQQKNFHESVALYSLEQMKELFARSRLKLIDQLGEYDGSPLTPDSARAIWIGKRAERE